MSSVITKSRAMPRATVTSCGVCRPSSAWRSSASLVSRWAANFGSLASFSSRCTWSVLSWVSFSRFAMSGSCAFVSCQDTLSQPTEVAKPERRSDLDRAFSRPPLTTLVLSRISAVAANFLTASICCWPTASVGLAANSGSLA
jgi:hypothetical protein